MIRVDWRQILAFFYFVTSALLSHGQAVPSVEDLHQQLLTVQEDTAYVELLQLLALAYENQNIDSAKFYAERAYTLAQQVGDQKSIATSLERLAWAVYYQNQVDSAITLGLQA